MPCFRQSNLENVIISSKYVSPKSPSQNIVWTKAILAQQRLNTLHCVATERSPIGQIGHIVQPWHLRTWLTHTNQTCFPAFNVTCSTTTSVSHFCHHILLKLDSAFPLVLTNELDSSLPHNSNITWHHHRDYWLNLADVISDKPNQIRKMITLKQMRRKTFILYLGTSPAL